MKGNGRGKLPLLALLCAAWMAALAAGMSVLWNYSGRPGQAGPAPASWPAASDLRPAEARLTLLMFLHPHCPCSRASIGELAVLMRHAQGLIEATALFYTPNGAPADWHQTDLWTSAAAIPGVAVRVDRDARAARRFGAATSGATLLYDARGRLLFAGGITSSRGHAGDNAGRSSVLAFARGGQALARVTPVYGCQITVLDAGGAACLSQEAPPCHP